MMKFKVQAEKCLGMASRDFPRCNPFMIRDIFDPNLPKIRYLVREWEIEAADEKEVKRLFHEAKDLNIAGLDGFEIVLIERI